MGFNLYNGKCKRVQAKDEGRVVKVANSFHALNIKS
jgi:hypothetical protein